ncbi:MAG: hypothetical protein ACFBWO_16575 [Paracoccaceae bacterium]
MRLGLLIFVFLALALLIGGVGTARCLQTGRIGAAFAAFATAVVVALVTFLALVGFDTEEEGVIVGAVLAIALALLGVRASWRSR